MPIRLCHHQLLPQVKVLQLLDSPKVGDSKILRIIKLNGVTFQMTAMCLSSVSTAFRKRTPLKMEPPTKAHFKSPWKCKILTMDYLRLMETSISAVQICNMTGVGTAQSVYRLATGWTARGSNPNGDKRYPLLQKHSYRFCSPHTLLFN